MAYIHHARSTGARVVINARDSALTLIEDNATAYTFDAAGRLVTVFAGGSTFRRSLANEIVEKRSGVKTGLSHRLRRVLDADEVRRLEEAAYAYAFQIASELAPASAADTDRDDQAIVRAALGRTGAYSYGRLQEEAGAYLKIYKRVPILPPDQYLAVVLQATEGCSYNACSFCGFYRDRRFRIRTSGEFRAHAAEVKAFFGRGLSLRRSIFLGDANALIIPDDALLPVLDIVNEEFELLPSGLSAQEIAAWKSAHPLHFTGIYSFIDAFTTRRKTARQYERMAQRGVRRVYVGLESGDADLLRFLGKPNTPDDVAELVRRVKAGGINAGLIVLVGAGGDRYADAHAVNTVSLLSQLPLDSSDVIYLSELVDAPGSTYSILARNAGIAPMSHENLERRTAELRTALQASARAGSPGPVVSYYDIREFMY